MIRLLSYAFMCMYLGSGTYIHTYIHTYLLLSTCAVHSNPPASPPTAAAKQAITQEKVMKYSRKMTEIRNPQTYIQYPHVPITKPLFHPIASTRGLATRKAVRAKHTYNIPPQILLKSFPNSALAYAKHATCAYKDCNDLFTKLRFSVIKKLISLR